ncbi:MAG: protein translocase subunit SecD [Deferribacteraceae bacterium]|jgi:preprotein translocase subunit SecD|nr:protein translocase subunit SecD [Deferribacteraceae bacterium]
MNLKFRWAVIIVILGVALFGMLPLNEKVRLGLDLQGGMHVVLGVDTEKAVEARVDSMIYQLRRELQREELTFSYVQKTPPYALSVGIDGANADISRQVNDIATNFGLDSINSGDANVLSFQLSDAEIEQLRQNAVNQALEVIRNRVDQFGVAEAMLQRQGRNQILVQLPGITDPDRAISLIGQTAQLKFHMVNPSVSQAQLDAGTVPYDTIIMYGKDVDPATGKVIATHPYPLMREVSLTGDSLLDAGVQYNEYNEPVVWFRFDPAGARIFSDLTANNVGRQLAIVLDDTVYSAPNINERIPGGEGSISGNFTQEDANDLAIVLRAGSLPAPVEILENRTVGASLGADSINSGVKACVIGLVLIMIVMLIYYKLSGIVANIGLVANFVILLGVLCLVGATLTLPGIAGIILTLGMAVDANILIFERIREELRNKRTVMNAFEIGYQKAFATIVDANITTLIAAIVLYQFGTGPVKGFAVTLSIGLIASMFTAVYVTKTIFMTFIVRKDPEKISI